MKGMKVSLDTHVNGNLIDWRKLGLYNASNDALYAKIQNYSYVDVSVPAPYNEKEGYYCISFEVKSDNAQYFTTHYVWGSSALKQTVSYSKGGLIYDDFGHVDFYLRKGVWERFFTVYKMAKDGGSIFLRFRPGDTYVRNVKLEYSDHPTDYEE